MSSKTIVETKDTPVETHNHDSVYEPLKGADDNYVTDAEKTVIGNTSGTNTGDQDLSGYAQKSNVLELDNTTAFTPDADYEPATKKYVDDNAGGGGGLTNFTEAENTSSPNATVPAVSLTAVSTATNADAVLQPKGMGAILAQIPDGTTTGGNKRGQFAVDLQLYRSSNSDVASGYISTVIGGKGNAARGSYTISAGGYANHAVENYSAIFGGYGNGTPGLMSGILAGRNGYITGAYSAILAGYNCVISSDYACATGYYANAYLEGQVTHATGRFSTTGDAQKSEIILRGTTTDATPTEIFLDGSSVRAVLPSNTTWKFTLDITGRRTDADNENLVAQYQGGIKRDATAGTTALIGSVTESFLQQDNSWSVSATADSSNGSLKITVTGETSKSIRWVASVSLTEVGG